MKTVLLSFDIEEFDMPMEYGKSLSLDEQIQVSAEGTEIILDILKAHGVQATFFSTVIFASRATDLIRRITNEGHELASHGYFHSTFENEHLSKSRVELENISGQKIIGFRMARMKPVSDIEIENAGYTYNSSLNPVYLPGRYNNFFKPRTQFKTNTLIQLPASATPLIRFPLFWLSFHHLPMWLYNAGCRYTINADHYLNIYFHPWEFIDLTNPNYGLPNFLSKRTGSEMVERFDSWISWMKNQDYSFSTIRNFLTRTN